MEFNFPPHRIVINQPDRESVLNEVRRRLTVREGFTLATLNLDHLVKIGRDESFRQAYSEHDLIVADGNPIVWLSRLAGRPVSLVPGSDILVPLAEQAVWSGVKVALMGSTPESLERAAASLERQVRGINIVFKGSPSMGFDPSGPEADDIIWKIYESGARMVFVALGAPKQEIFAARGRELLPGVGFASIGAGLDFLSGKQTRAPAWARKYALEWFWRMMTNPRRLAGRYLACMAILPSQAWQALMLRLD